jgi:hypothetical protein
MAQPPHFDIDGSIIFITTRLSEKGRLFTESETNTNALSIVTFY